MTGLITLLAVMATGLQEIPADKDPTTTQSGMKVSFLQSGPEGGKSPTLSDTVRVHYTGWLVDGTVFDSSRNRGQPAEFKLGAVIEGWNEGVQMMKVGDRVKLEIPPELAYGDQGVPGAIPPGSTLIFDVELLGYTEGQGVPDFRRLDPNQTKTTASGLKYQMIQDGVGPTPGETGNFILTFTFWSNDGDLVDCSALSGQPIKGNAAQMNLAFLKEAAHLVKPGGRCLFEVPPQLGFGDRELPNLKAGATTIWDIVSVPEPAKPTVAEDQWKEGTQGLKYAVLRSGDASGAHPTATTTVRVHYSGWLDDGTLFDTSTGGDPARFPLNRVIPGWTLGLQLMKPGDVFVLRVPSVIGYGSRGSPPMIPPNADLTFLVELVGIDG